MKLNRIAATDQKRCSYGAALRWFVADGQGRRRIRVTGSRVLSSRVTFNSYGTKVDPVRVESKVGGTLAQQSWDLEYTVLDLSWTSWRLMVD